MPGSLLSAVRPEDGGVRRGEGAEATRAIARSVEGLILQGVVEEAEIVPGRSVRMSTMTFADIHAVADVEDEIAVEVDVSDALERLSDR